MAPARAVLVVAAGAERGQASVRRRGVHPLDLCVEAVATDGDEVAGVDDDVGSQRHHASKDVVHIGVGHTRPDVDVRELHERAADERRRQAAEGQVQPHDLEPVRLDLPAVDAEPRGGGRRLQQPAAADAQAGH
jgi:hypothetical protein